MEIRVEWERVVQTKPYESLRVRLGVTETVLLPEEKQGSVIGPSSVPVIARATAEFERVFFEGLAKVGEALIAEQLGQIQNPPILDKNDRPQRQQQQDRQTDAEGLFPYEPPKSSVSGARRR